ncbi:hypothetical protein [Halorubrum sp. Ea8]|uniref:hypothetical protein n=1 Tax=Halorubrum sp. Ea8 TaxID=1383841 RepID=UPI000B9939B7|nr:hypothetical protein [Halorubrum sp. Ea8]OYR49827.1 hypothetical protein DJ74_07540 [Halorubrum sp. Ea8]
MKRRSATVVLGSALGGLAGCAERLPTDPTAADGAATVADSFDGGPDRPDCAVDSRSIEVTVSNETREYETAATVPYPDPPTAVTERDVVEWVPSFEEAYLSRDVLCERSGSAHILRVDYRTDLTEVLDGSGDVTVVYLRYAGGATAGVDDGGMWEADIGFTAVSYAVDETGAARVEFDRPLEPGHEEFESERRDPIEEGAFVAAFD